MNIVFGMITVPNAYCSLYDTFAHACRPRGEGERFHRRDGPYPRIELEARFFEPVRHDA